ncbi:hypothetical protein ACFLQW_01430 [Candidatus Zixiibacteriota bacterium]
MPSNKDNRPDHRRPKSWGRLALGILGLAGVLFFFTSGVTPPGVCGDVVRHNRANTIDATPYFYSEVENIVELQAGLDQWWLNGDSAKSKVIGKADSTITLSEDGQSSRAIR